MERLGLFSSPSPSTWQNTSKKRLAIQARGEAAIESKRHRLSPHKIKLKEIES